MPDDIDATRKLLGDCFTEYCHNKREYRLDTFLKALGEKLPGATVQQIHYNPGVWELYLTSHMEANPHRYWGVTHKGTTYLLPRPVTPEKFEGVGGKVFPEGETLRPSTLEKIVPGILEGQPGCWEIVEHEGGLNKVVPDIVAKATAAVKPTAEAMPASPSKNRRGL